MAIGLRLVRLVVALIPPLLPRLPDEVCYNDLMKYLRKGMLLGLHPWFQRHITS